MDVQLIQTKIHNIRGQKVMLDSDLADLYGVETRVLNQAVKRNIERFPEDFMFRLTYNEWQSMLSQIVMTLRTKRPKSALPLVFTEHGVTMLSSILNSKTAIQINIQVVRAFIAVKQIVSIAPADKFSELREDVNQLKKLVEEILIDQTDINEDTRMQIELIHQSLAELQTNKKISEKPRRRVGFITED